MREYIVPVANTDKTNEGMYIGFIRTRHELIRCKDCKFSSPNGVYGCRIKSFADDMDERMYADDWCSHGDKREEE